MKKRTNKEFLESLATYDKDLEHDDKCGVCFHMECMAKAAREILASKKMRNAIARWDVAAKKLWQEGKYYKLWKKEAAAGRDPHMAFKRRRWEP
jgi:hypothetical protein